MSATPYRHAQKRSPTTPLTPMVRNNVRRKVDDGTDSLKSVQAVLEDPHEAKDSASVAETAAQTDVENVPPQPSTQQEPSRPPTQQSSSQKTQPSRPSSSDDSSLALLAVYRRAWLNERKYLRQKELVKFLERERACS
ncbi:hypothetical protein KL921_000124 [Ogataea angusta]|uniref:Uncharacterized protein n=1 Tax=Pichia angusta TaxID=870730 RepID=A0AAN6DJR3_PICAN|nr:uncharacterized protein KL928_000668 [Ogataea angusta]KAG7813850.1 hypothetical protein KL921_000124 [Ogataea angusta]KAG7822193.1 hypothetical protein KL928_000668 [Ogataea angusta]KAG7831542.1 hypothetical protein KL920_001062 [Ogataea angusta]KAG7832430.1 hypothetical protein KL943_005088 [Ogataea angusta]KAG7842320.1 hypothetical protein KL942_001058 [Ogataea angusta]